MVAWWTRRSTTATVEGFAGRWPGFGEMAFEAATGALGDLMFGKGSKKACRRPAFLVGLSGERGPDLFDGGQAQLGEEQLDAGSIARIGRFHAAPPSRTVLSSS
jgi:hypothetical protein